MIKIPKSIFVDSLTVGNVYLLHKHALKNTIVPHYFIAVGISNEEVVLFTCSTTQFEKRKKHIELNKLPLTTLVYIKPDKAIGLPLESYVDCNSLFDYKIIDLLELLNSGLMQYKGIIPEGKLEEIRQGINDSPQVEGEFKNIINGNEDF